DPCGQIGETAAFDRAVKVARDYAERHPDTLVIATADHAQSSQIVPVDAEPMGLSATLVTDEGGRLKVSYATTTTPEDGQEHTGTQVRIAAQGPFSERVSGVTDQTQLFTTITDALGLG
ncbi:alkaline phosphatase, partial [Streptomyces sp. SID625]|nr:alkaline phosphatase [Streptomyces sp. SID625]